MSLLKNLFDKNNSERKGGKFYYHLNNLQPQYYYPDRVIIISSLPNLFYLGPILIHLIYLYLNFMWILSFWFSKHFIINLALHIGYLTWIAQLSPEAGHENTSFSKCFLGSERWSILPNIMQLVCSRARTQISLMFSKTTFKCLSGIQYSCCLASNCLKPSKVTFWLNLCKYFFWYKSSKVAEH